MRKIIEYLNFRCGDYVIVGSLALWLHNMLDEYSHKDIDIVVDVPKNEYDNDWIKREDRFSGWGWSTQVGNYYIDVFNTELPEYNTVTYDDLQFKVITISALKKHYRTIDNNKIGGHDRFRQKLITRIELFK